MRFATRIWLLGIVMGVMLGSGVAAADGNTPPDRGRCQTKAADAVKNFDKWITEYTRQMQSVEPVKRPKYEEWIRELNKLKALVQQAKAKLANQKLCSTDECVGDQCSLIDIADQQVAQLIRETEEQLGGDSARFGGESGREVTHDPNTVGDSAIPTPHDSEDAQQQNTADQSNNSSITATNPLNPCDLFYSDPSCATSGLTPENPRQEISPQ